MVDGRKIEYAPGAIVELIYWLKYNQIAENMYKIVRALLTSTIFAVSKECISREI